MKGMPDSLTVVNYPLIVGAAAGLLIAGNTHSADFSARNAAMGGAGVASSRYDAASASNPALLTRFEEDDDLALVIPAIGAEGSDEFEVIDNLDDVVDLYDALEQQINNMDAAGALNTKDTILETLEDIDQQPVRADAGVLVGLAKPGKNLAFAVEARARLDVFGFADYAPEDETIINSAIASGDSSQLDNINSSALAFGASVSELAVSLAREFSLGDKPLAVGVTPKYQTVETILYNATVRDFDEDDIDADEYTEDDSNLNLDVGLALGLSESLTVGLQLRDLIEEDYKTVEVAGYSSQYTIEPQATAGIAWRGDFMTLALDADLTERQPFDEVDGSQYLRAGVEFDLAGWLQLRAGARHDMEDTREDLLTAGIGLSPFETFRVDLTAAAGDEDTYGFAADLRLTF